MPQLLTLKLRDTNSQEYKILQTLNHHASVKNGPYEILISYNPIRYLILGRAYVHLDHPNKIFMQPLSKNEPYTDMVIAHEIGHLENDTKSDFVADEFAAKIVGAKRVLDALRWMSKNYGEYEEGNQRIKRMEDLVKN